MQPHGQLLLSHVLHISNSSVSASLVGHVIYSADLMSVICFSYLLLMVHRYIYSRYSPVFGMLYQLYHSLSSSTLISSSSLYLSVTTWVTPQGHNRYHLLNYQYLGNCHDWCFDFRNQRSPFYTTQNEPKTVPRQLIFMKIWKPQCLYMDFINYPLIVICPFLRTKDSLHKVKLSLYSA